MSKIKAVGKIAQLGTGYVRDFARVLVRNFRTGVETKNLWSATISSTRRLRNLRYQKYGVWSRSAARTASLLTKIGMGARTAGWVAKAMKGLAIAGSIAVPINLARRSIRGIKNLGKLFTGNDSDRSSKMPMVQSPGFSQSPVQLGESVVKSSSNQSKTQLELELAKAKAEQDLWSRIAKKVPLPKQQIRQDILQKISAKGPTTDHKLDAIIELLNQQSIITNDVRKNTYSSIQLKIAELEGKSERATKLYQSIIQLQIQQQSANAEALDSIRKSNAQHQKSMQQMQIQQFQADQSTKSMTKSLSLGQIAIGLGAITLLRNIVEKTHENGSIIGGAVGGVIDTVKDVFGILFGKDDSKDPSKINSTDKDLDTVEKNLSNAKDGNSADEEESGLSTIGKLGVGALGIAGANLIQKRKNAKADRAEVQKIRDERGALKDELRDEHARIDNDENLTKKQKAGKKSAATKAHKKKLKALETKSTERLAQRAAKKGAKGLLKRIGGKLIPGAGLAFGISEAIQRFKAGEVVPGILSAVSGIASLFPGVGTGVALAIDAGLIGYDAIRASKTEDDGTDVVPEIDMNSNDIAAAQHAYAKGTQHSGVVSHKKEKVHPGGPAIVGDGGRSEVIISPDNKTATITPDKATAVNLPKGTKVIPMVKAMPGARRYAKGTEVSGVTADTVESIPMLNKQLKDAVVQKVNGELTNQEAIDNRARYLWYLLSDKMKDEVRSTFGGELSDYHIAAILGTWMRESQLAPWLYNKGEAEWTKYYGRGLAQWTNKDRQADVYNIYRKRKGLKSDDPIPDITEMSYEDQLGLFLGEIQGKYKYIRNNFLKTENLKDATDMFLRAYENGGGSGMATIQQMNKAYKASNNYHKQIADRYASAEVIHNKYLNKWKSTPWVRGSEKFKEVQEMLYRGRDESLKGAVDYGTPEYMGNGKFGGVDLTSQFENLGKLLEPLNNLFGGNKYAMGTQNSPKAIYAEPEETAETTKSASTTESAKSNKPVFIDQHKNGDTINNYYNNTTVNNNVIYDRSKHNELGQI